MEGLPLKFETLFDPDELAQWSGLDVSSPDL